MDTRAVIIQSNYIPWKGYFDLLSHADIVVFFDSVQSTKNDWRNRNIIKTHSGNMWLTIPVRHSNTLRIRDVEIASTGWHSKHLRSIRQSYARAPFATDLIPEISDWYEQAGQMTHLSAINRLFIERISRFLGLRYRSMDVKDVLSDDEHDKLEPTARLVEVCKRIDASSYLSGPSARDYLEVRQFDQAHIAVDWFDYDGYPEYQQLHGSFDPAVSILDLILMNGPRSPKVALRERR